MSVFYSDDEFGNQVLTLGFWYYGTLRDRSGFVYEGPLRCNIRLDERFEYSEGGVTEEGYHITTYHFEFYEDEDGDLVLTKTRVDESRDCDGRLDQLSRYRAESLDTRPDHYDPGVMYPVWKEERLHRGEYAQRDYTAEAMGY